MRKPRSGIFRQNPYVESFSKIVGIQLHVELLDQRLALLEGQHPVVVLVGLFEHLPQVQLVLFLLPEGPDGEDQVGQGVHPMVSVVFILCYQVQGRPAVFENDAEAHVGAAVDLPVARPDLVGVFEQVEGVGTVSAPDLANVIQIDAAIVAVRKSGAGAVGHPFVGGVLDAKSRHVQLEFPVVVLDAPHRAFVPDLPQPRPVLQNGQGLLDGLGSAQDI